MSDLKILKILFHNTCVEVFLFIIFFDEFATQIRGKVKKNQNRIKSYLKK